MTGIALRPDEANCFLCRRGPKNGNDCPLKGSVQNARLRQERHDCTSFRPLSQAQLLNRKAKEQTAEQEALF